MTVGRFAVEQLQAQEQITEDGEESLYDVRTSTPIPGQRWRSSGVSSSTTTVNAVWLRFKEDEIDGNRIRKADQKVLVPALDLLPVTPNPSTDFLTRVDGSRWKVEDVKTLQPNEDVIMHTLQVRKVSS